MTTLTKAAQDAAKEIFNYPNFSPMTLDDEVEIILRHLAPIQAELDTYNLVRIALGADNAQQALETVAKVTQDNVELKAELERLKKEMDGGGEKFEVPKPCAYCLKFECECCDADVNPNMGAK